MLDTIHQYGLRSSLHQSCSRKWQQWSRWHLKVTGKRTSLVQSRIHPSPILFKEVTTTRNPCSLEQNLLLSEGSRPYAGRGLSCSIGRVESECSTAFWPRGHHCSQEERKYIYCSECRAIWSRRQPPLKCFRRVACCCKEALSKEELRVQALAEVEKVRQRDIQCLKDQIKSLIEQE